MGWPMVRLGEVLRHRKEFILIEPDGMYARCRVQTAARGVVLRDRVAGSEIKTKKQQVCRTGEFLVAEIDAKLGGYGLVPNDLEGAIVSSHYFLFEVGEHDLNRRYLHWCSKTPWFLEQVQARGSTNYAAIRPASVLDMRIPLPPLDEQRRIAARLDRVAALVEDRRRAALAAERETRALLLAEFARAIDGAPRRPMREVAPLIRRPVEIDPDRQYTEIGVKSFYRGVFHRRTMPGSEFSWQKLSSIKEGDLIFSNLMAWEKGIAVAGTEDDGCVGNHRMLTCNVDPELATPGFLLMYFMTDEGFGDVIGHSPGSIARNKTLSSRKLETIEVPIPPIERQRAFDGLQARAREIAEIRARAETDLDALLPALLHETFGEPA